MTTTEQTRNAMARRDAHLRAFPVVCNCPGCGTPIRTPQNVEFVARENWCPGCGGIAPIAKPSEPDTGTAYAEAARIATGTV